VILYHGTTFLKAESILENGFYALCSTEGCGVYLAEQEKFALFFTGYGDRLITVDANIGRVIEADSLYILREEFGHRDFEWADTEWARLNEQAIRDSHDGRIPGNGEPWDPDAAEMRLTELLEVCNTRSGPY